MKKTESISVVGQTVQKLHCGSKAPEGIHPHWEMLTGDPTSWLFGGGHERSMALRS